jgi:hypothetical protein
MLRPEVHAMRDFAAAFDRLQSHPGSCLKVCLRGNAGAEASDIPAR